MKKLFLAGAFIVSVMALAATTSKQKTKNSSPALYAACFQDTIPDKKDTSNAPLPDTTNAPLPPAR